MKVNGFIKILILLTSLFLFACSSAPKDTANKPTATTSSAPEQSLQHEKDEDDDMERMD